MEILQYIHDNDTVFTLVTKRLTRHKMHELLDKLQEFVSTLQENDLSDDVVKDLTIKKNFQNAGSQVYLNYGFQTPKPSFPVPEPQELTMKRFYPELAVQKRLDLLDDSIIPTKKIKPNISLEQLGHNSSSIAERRQSLAQSHLSGHKMSSFLKCLEKGYKTFSSIQKSPPTQESYEIQKDKYVPQCQPDFTAFSPLYKNSFEYSSMAQITSPQNTVEIDKDELINQNSDSLNLLNNTSERFNDIKGQQGMSEFIVNFAEYKFSSNYENRKSSRKVYETSPEDREMRRPHEKSSYKRHEHSKRRNHDKSTYSNKINYSSDKKYYKHYDKYSHRSRERNIVVDDNAEAPLFLIDAKENEAVYKHLRKPFHYFKTVREMEDESNCPNYIQVD